MRLVCLISLTLLLAACADEPYEPQAYHLDQDWTATAFALECSTPVGAVTHPFAGWGSLSATEYACSGALSKMTCASFRSSDHVEIKCEVTSTADPQGVPGGCTLATPSGLTAIRIFFDGSIRTVKAYTCGIMSSVAACVYYVAQDGSGAEEFICSDHSLPPGRRTQWY